jgi:hypothetical protein
MTTMMIGGAAADTVAGTAIPRATPRHRVAAGKSVAALTAAIATMMTIAAVRCRQEMTKADSPARDRATMITMMIGGAAADTVAGTAIRKVTPKRHGAVADNRPSG